MTLIASNLGQILGRLAYGDDTERVPARQKKTLRPRGQLDAQVLALVGKKPAIACRDLVAALGISIDYAALVLGKLYREGKLSRTGARCRYRYSLA